jgi:hypothetical protein
MDLIFDDDGIVIVCLVGNQLIGRLKLDVVTITLELGHQIGGPVDGARPTSDFLEDLVDEVVNDDIARRRQGRLAPAEPDRSKARRPHRRCISDSASEALHALWK